MPSATHEGVIEVFRQEPTFVAKVLREILKIDLPRFNRVHFSEATLRERGVTRHADALALFDNKNQPVFVSILEVQLYVDDAKLYSWPFYAIVARTHHTCPCALLVVTTTRATERWASRPIDLGGGNTFRPLVLGPSNIPMVTSATARCATLPSRCYRHWLTANPEPARRSRSSLPRSMPPSRSRTRPGCYT